MASSSPAPEETQHDYTINASRLSLGSFEESFRPDSYLPVDSETDPASVPLPEGNEEQYEDAVEEGGKDDPFADIGSPLAHKQQTAPRRPGSGHGRRLSSFRNEDFLASTPRIEEEPEYRDANGIGPAVAEVAQRAEEEDEVLYEEDTIASLPSRTPSLQSRQSSYSFPSRQATTLETPLRPTMGRAPTDTAIAERVRNISIPASAMKELQTRSYAASDAGGSINGGGGLTLKEQGGVIDKLRKDNFGLQLKIYFLSDMLEKRNEDSVNEVLNQNIELKTALLKLNRTLQEQKRLIAQLEKQLAGRGESPVAMQNEGLNDEEYEELLSLREQITTYEYELDRLRRLHVQHEEDMEELRNLAKKTSADTGVDARLWEEIIERERSEKEMYQRECEDLRRQLQEVGTQPQLTSEHEELEALVEKLQGDNDDLRRDLSAQVARLTAHQREKEHLYQELEEARLNQRASTRSGGQEEYEEQINELRDRVTELRGEKAELRNELDNAMRDLHDIQDEGRREIQILVEENRLLSEDKEAILSYQEELENAFETYKVDAVDENGRLKEEIMALGDDIELIQNDLTHFQMERDDALSRMQGLEGRLQEREERCERMRVLLEESERRTRGIVDMEENKVDDLQRRVQELTQDKMRLEAQLERTNSEVRNLREQADGAAVSVGDLEHLRRTTERKFAEKQRRIEELEDEVERVRRSGGASQEETEKRISIALEDKEEEVEGLKKEMWTFRQKFAKKDEELKGMQSDLSVLERAVRQALGDTESDRVALARVIGRLREDYEHTLAELDEARQDIAQHEDILRGKEGQLELIAIETRKLSEKLIAETKARKSAESKLREVETGDSMAKNRLVDRQSRVTDLERAREREHQSFKLMESQYREQMNERNKLLADLYERISSISGIRGDETGGTALPTTNFPKFSRNLSDSLKTLEKTMNTTTDKFKKVQQELWKEYKNLEQALEQRTKRLSKLEHIVRSTTADGEGVRQELAMLKLENRSMKAEMKDKAARSPAKERAKGEESGSGSGSGDGERDKMWEARLKELESRLKAEKEGRIRDHRGAKEKLNALLKENEDLKKGKDAPLLEE
ncbi:hypothetical protein YB2330_000004 [Saitoella coloradoensis]